MTSGQFRTLAMFSSIIIVDHHPGNCIFDLSDMQIYLKQLTLSSKGSTANDMGIHGHGAQSPCFYQTLKTQSVVFRRQPSLIQVLNPFAFLLASLLLLLLGLTSLLLASASCCQPEQKTGGHSFRRATMQVRRSVRLFASLSHCHIFWQNVTISPICGNMSQCHTSVATF